MTRTPSEIDLASAWLEGLLTRTGGSCPAKDIQRAAKAQGRFSFKTLLRAKRSLVVRSQQTASGWIWTTNELASHTTAPPDATAADAATPVEAFAAGPDHLRKQAVDMYKTGFTLAAVERDLLEIARNCPTDPPLSEEAVLAIAREVMPAPPEPPLNWEVVFSNPDIWSAVLTHATHQQLHDMLSTVRTRAFELHEGGQIVEADRLTAFADKVRTAMNDKS